MRFRPGAGPGWNVSAVLTNDHTWPILFDRSGNDASPIKPVGYMRDSTKGAKSDSGKENTESFLDVMKASFKAMADQYPNIIKVLVIDGAGTHRMMEEGSWNPHAMNLKKPSPDKPITMHAKLQELGINHVGLTRDKAMEILLNRPEFIKQRLAVEAIAEHYGCFVLFLPCAHPVLNPIERYWRLVKCKVRAKNGPTKGELATIIDLFHLSNDWCEAHLANMFDLSHLYMLYFHMTDIEKLNQDMDVSLTASCIDYSRPAAPSERQIKKLFIQGKLPSSIPTNTFHERLGSPTRDYEIEDEVLRSYLHMLNMRRITRSESEPI